MSGVARASMESFELDQEGQYRFEMSHAGFPGIRFVVTLAEDGRVLSFRSPEEFENQSPLTAGPFDEILREAKDRQRRIVGAAVRAPDLLGPPVGDAKPYSDLYYALLAYDYVELVGTTRHPVEDLARHWQRPRDTISGWLVEARKRGLLSEPPDRKPGGSLTDRAWNVLKDGRDNNQVDPRASNILGGALINRA
jgi:hypothetical protein